MISSKRWVIYRIVCTKTAKQYIGITGGSIERRWRRHRNDINRLDGPLQRSMRLYGFDEFCIKPLIEVASLEDALRLESLLISLMQTLAPRGLNATTGGEHPHPSPESRAKQRVPHSQARREKNRQAQIALAATPAGALRIARLSAALKGRKLSAEHRRNIGNGHRGLKRSAATIEAVRRGLIGKRASPETRAILSAAHMGKPWSQARRAAYETRWRTK